MQPPSGEPEAINNDTATEDITSTYERLTVAERDELSLYLAGKRYDDLQAKSGRKYRKIIREILEGDPLVVRNKREQYKVLTFLVPDPKEGDLLNLVILKQKGKPRQAQLYKYELSDQFKDSLRLGLASMHHFRGKMHVLPKEALIEQLEKSQYEDCFELAIQNPTLNKPSSAGGGGGPTSPSGPGPSGGPTFGGDGGGSGPGGGITPGCTEVVYRPGYDKDGNYQMVIIIQRCGTGPIVREAPGSDHRPQDGKVDPQNWIKPKNNEVDCGELLKILGIVGRYNNSRVTAGSRDEQLVEVLLNRTAYSELAVKSFIDIAKLRSCGSTLNCINAQVADYLETIIYADYSSGLRRSLTSLSTNQLAAILGAVYGSSQNDHVLAAVEYALLRSDIMNASELTTHLLVLAALHDHSPRDFNTLAADYLAIVQSGKSLSDVAYATMAMSPPLVHTVADGLKDFPALDINKLLERASLSSTPSRLGSDILAMYRTLDNRGRFSAFTPEQALLLDQLPGLFDNLPQGAADLLWGDKSRLSQEEIAPVIAAYIKRAAIKGGAAAVLDIGIQFSFEYLLGDYETVSAAFEGLNVDWWSVLGSAVEANLKPKYAAYVGAGSGALKAVTDRLVAGEDLTIAQIFSDAVIGGIKGFISAHLGDHVGRFTGKFIKFGYSGVRRTIQAEFGTDLFLKLCRNYSVFRKDALRALWKETDVAGAQFSRGFLMEEILAQSRYARAVWVNVNGDLNGPVDYLQGQTAIQLKSIADISLSSTARKNFRASAVKALKQLDKALTDGVQFGGRNQSISDVTIDFAIPENMSQYASSQQKYISEYLSGYVADRPYYFRSLNSNNFSGTVTVNIGTFND